MCPGNKGVLRPGDLQWMTAGRGVVHSEMPGEAMTRGLQVGISTYLEEYIHHIYIIYYTISTLSTAVGQPGRGAQDGGAQLPGAAGQPCARGRGGGREGAGHRRVQPRGNLARAHQVRV